jgi:uncharacterized protein YecE (DUF72 family)
MLRAHEVALVVSDGAGIPRFDDVTADLVYVRLHGHDELYRSGYDAAALRDWAAKALAWAAEGREVLVYFDNDAEGRAPHDALALRDAVAEY